MPIEQRVVSGSKIGGNNKIGGGSASSSGGDDAAPTKKKASKKKLIIVVVAVLAIAGGTAYFFLFKGKDSAEAAPPPPERGAVLAIDPVSLNLAEGHYLRLGLSLQLTKDAGEETPDTADALDHAIALFSGHTVAEVSDPATREALKAQLVTELDEAYEGKVMDVYLTNYVTQ
jgi:flagellar FliL protein